MAALPTRTITVTEFRLLVVIAFLAHAIVLFILPNMRFLFSPDVMQLMQYGGHGARINPTHPIVSAIYFLPLAAFVGLFLLQAGVATCWPRSLCLRDWDRSSSARQSLGHRRPSLHCLLT